MPNKGKTYQYSAVLGGMIMASTAPKATVEPSTTATSARPRSSPSGGHVGRSVTAARRCQIIHLGVSRKRR